MKSVNQTAPKGKTPALVWVKMRGGPRDGQMVQVKQYPHPEN